MKIKFLLPVLGMFLMAIAFSNNNTSVTDELDQIFVESDNIAFAEGGYSCGPFLWRCTLPNNGGYLYGYVKHG